MDSESSKSRANEKSQRKSRIPKLVTEVGKQSSDVAENDAKKATQLSDEEEITKVSPGCSHEVLVDSAVKPFSLVRTSKILVKHLLNEQPQTSVKTNSKKSCVGRTNSTATRRIVRKAEGATNEVKSTSSKAKPTPVEEEKKNIHTGLVFPSMPIKKPLMNPLRKSFSDKHKKQEIPDQIDNKNRRKEISKTAVKEKEKNSKSNPCSIPCTVASLPKINNRGLKDLQTLKPTKSTRRRSKSESEIRTCFATLNKAKNLPNSMLTQSKFSGRIGNNSPTNIKDNAKEKKTSELRFKTKSEVGQSGLTFKLKPRKDISRRTLSQEEKEFENEIANISKRTNLIDNECCHTPVPEFQITDIHKDEIVENASCCFNISPKLFLEKKDIRHTGLKFVPSPKSQNSFDRSPLSLPSSQRRRSKSESQILACLAEAEKVSKNLERYFPSKFETSTKRRSKSPVSQPENDRKIKREISPHLLKTEVEMDPSGMNKFTYVQKELITFPNDELITRERKETFINAANNTEQTNETCIGIPSITLSEMLIKDEKEMDPLPSNSNKTPMLLFPKEEIEQTGFKTFVNQSTQTPRRRSKTESEIKSSLAKVYEARNFSRTLENQLKPKFDSNKLRRRNTIVETRNDPNKKENKAPQFLLKTKAEVGQSGLSFKFKRAQNKMVPRLTEEPVSEAAETTEQAKVTINDTTFVLSKP